MRHCPRQRPRCGPVGSSRKGSIDGNLDDIFGGPDWNHARPVDLGKDRETLQEGVYANTLVPFRRDEEKHGVLTRLPWYVVAFLFFDSHCRCLFCIVSCSIAACFHVHLNRILQDAGRDWQERGFPRRGKPHGVQMDWVSIGSPQGRGLPPSIWLRGGHRICVVSGIEYRSVEHNGMELLDFGKFGDRSLLFVIWRQTICWFGLATENLPSLWCKPGSFFKQVSHSFIN